MSGGDDARVVVISCDGHAAGRPADYAPYIDPAYRRAFDEWVRTEDGVAAARAAALEEDRFLFSKAGSEEFESRTGDMRDGEWDPALRTIALEDDGIVAEVLFPNSCVPFGAFGETAGPELRLAGNRAYDRWVLDFAQESPGRRAALAMLAVTDIGAAVAEVEWAAGAGMRGVILPTAPGDGAPPYVDPCYDPVWAACQDTGLPVHIHSGSGTPDYGDYGVVSMMLYATEVHMWARRPLWFLIWGGVLERFPALQVVFTETRAQWLPEVLELLDGIYAAPFFSHIRETVKHKPSEYWRRQCHIGASFMTAREAAQRQVIGLDTIMWGADYPHIEGTWPRSRHALTRAFAGVDAEDVRRILTHNPAELYRFEVGRLQPVADRVGPTMAEITAGG
ncbi:MAG TPA: amidohydrolase family protein [Acidimicrobiales bacterium]|nr:amidohydrolase family protein [Acidimicrobiales bacterium]